VQKKVMLNNNKKCDGGFHVVWFCYQQMYRDAEGQNHFTPSGFYYMKPEKKELLLFWLKKTCSYREIRRSSKKK
jgi:hypothetical protein